MPTTKPLKTFLDEVRAIPPEDFDDSHLMPVLSDIVIRDDDLAPYKTWKEGGYSRNLVYRDDLFEMIVLCWDVGQESAIHNHAGQDGWVMVQEGTLEVTNYRLLTCDVTEKSGGRQPTPCKSGCHSELEKVDSLTVPAGTAVAEVGGEVHIHKIANPAKHGERAISIHIYSKPLDSCIIYDDSADSCQRVTLEYDTQPEAPSASV